MQLRISVQGRVQGVGFRPSIYRYAKSLGLSGFVRNLGNGNVEILLEGRKAVIDAFLGSLGDALPPLAEIMKMETEITKAPRQHGFRIVESGSPSRDTSTSFIPQDVATCDSCLKELMDADDRRFEYPFITCTDCGPRFTISKGPPFDRENTSMQPFPMCEECSREYGNPDDRRCHAQTIACAECGPRVWLVGPGGKTVRTKDPIGRTARLIDRGGIAAVKGVGGTHIACDAADDRAVKALRRILRRPYQPFALMARRLEDVGDFASLGPQEREWLLDWRRPIVVLDKVEPFPLSTLLAPDLGNIGVMLPYTPVHHLLLSKTKSPVLVMTSANVHDEPMILEQGRMRERLGAIGHLLWHNREIANRCDDSVVRFHGADPVMIRRSRGYVPHPIHVGPGDGHVVLGVGPELSSTACILKSGLAYLTQHVGNTSNFDTFNFLKDAISSLMKNTSTFHLDAVAHDMHPQFLSTRLARSLTETWDCPAYPVQHHFAHVYSLMAERRVDFGKRVMAIVSDGYGYGSDGEAWGGEILGVEGEEVRLGSLEPQPLIGGDEATIHPVRVATGILAKVYKEDRLRRIIRRFCYDGLTRGERELDLIIQQLDRGYNVHQSTSTGRVLDAVSALLGISYERTYEGEGAMRLEGIAIRGDPAALVLPVEVARRGDRYVFETTPLLEGVVDALEARSSREDIAASAQEAIGRGLAAMANLCAEEYGPDVVGCSGGVMYNRQIVSAVEANLRFPLLKHVHLPPGDGCISLGQAALARRRLEDDGRSA